MSRSASGKRKVLKAIIVAKRKVALSKLVKARTSERISAMRLHQAELLKQVEEGLALIQSQTEDAALAARAKLEWAEILAEEEADLARWEHREGDLSATQGVRASDTTTFAPPLPNSAGMVQAQTAAPRPLFDWGDSPPPDVDHPLLLEDLWEPISSAPTGQTKTEETKRDDKASPSSPTSQTPSKMLVEENMTFSLSKLSVQKAAIPTTTSPGEQRLHGLKRSMAGVFFDEDEDELPCLFCSSVLALDIQAPSSSST